MSTTEKPPEQTTDPHPYYGPCDSLLPDGGCAECEAQRVGYRGPAPDQTAVVNNFPRLEINTEALRAAVERMLEVAADTKEEMGAVNWGDLGVADIEYRLSMLHPQNGPYCVVTVEEASPGCKLQGWLNRCLSPEFFPNTYIECEW